jgi:hypothetical protein
MREAMPAASHLQAQSMHRAREMSGVRRLVSPEAAVRFSAVTIRSIAPAMQWVPVFADGSTKSKERYCPYHSSKPLG